MSYTYPEADTLDGRIRYIDRVAAGLLAVEGLEGQAPVWEALREKHEAAFGALQRDERAELRAGALLDVRDTRWDKALGALSGETFHVSGKDAGALPYADWFRIPAKRAQGFGGNRAVTYGEDLLAQAERLGNERLKPYVEGFRAANSSLQAAFGALTAAQRAVRGHRIGLAELHEELQELLDKTEVEVLKLFPGDDELLRAILAPRRSKRRKPSEEPSQPEASPPQ